MIDFALSLITKELQDFISSRERPAQATETFVTLAPLLDKDGKPAIPDNTLGVSLVNIEEERIHRTPGPVRRQDGNQVSYANPPMKLHLYVLLSANFTTANYKIGLKRLSQALAFINSRNLFDAENTPTMDPGVERLTLELHSLTFEQMNQLWGSLGAKYLPSALFVVKLVPIDDKQVSDRRPPIIEVDTRGVGSPGDAS